MRKNSILFVIAIAVATSTACHKNPDKLNLRLKWAYQAQFAGYLVAQEKGFYKDAGLDVKIAPGGPDQLPYNTVASGIDDIGIGTISQILDARSNGKNLVALAQIFQDSPNRFVIKSKNRIGSLAELKGKKVGLWTSGDEVEFISMLKTVGLTIKDVDVIDQKFSVDPFINDEYVCSQVMVYNELNQLHDKGYKGDQLQVISPKDYHADILGDLIFTSQNFLSGHQDQLQRFLEASFKGWQYAKQHPAETVDMVMKYDPKLKRHLQAEQLDAILSLIYADNTQDHGIGYIDPADYNNAKQIMLRALDPATAAYTKLDNTPVSAAYNTALWSKIPAVK